MSEETTVQVGGLIPHARVAINSFVLRWLQEHREQSYGPATVQLILQLRKGNFPQILKNPGKLWEQIRENEHLREFVVDCTCTMLVELGVDANDLRTYLYTPLAISYGWMGSAGCVDAEARDRAIDQTALTQLLTKDPWVAALLVLQNCDVFYSLN